MSDIEQRLLKWDGGMDDHDTRILCLDAVTEIVRLEAANRELLEALQHVRNFGCPGTTNEDISVSYYVEKCLSQHDQATKPTEEPHV